MTTYPPLAQPLAIWQNFITPSQAPVVKLKGHYMSDDFDVTSLSTDQPILTVRAESMSLSHRQHIYDAQGTHLCTIRKETWKMGSQHYFAQPPAGGDDDNAPHLWDLQIKSGFTGSKCTLTFTDAATGRPEVLFFKNNPIGSHGEVKHRDQDGPTVASIDAQKMKMRTEYHVTCVPGMDLLLMVGLLLSLNDKVKSDTRTSAGVAGASSG